MSALRPSLQRAHVDDERLERRERHLVADLLDDLRRVVRVAAPRTGSSARTRTCGRGTAGGRARPPSWLRVMRTDAVDSSGYITPTMSDGPSCVSTNSRELLAHGHARAAAHVVVVEEDREQPDVVARRFGFLVVVGADWPWRLLDRPRHAPPSSLTSLKVSIFCGLPSSVTSKSAWLQIGDRVAVLVGDDDVDADEVDAGAETVGCAWRRAAAAAAPAAAGCGGWPAVRC